MKIGQVKIGQVHIAAVLIISLASIGAIVAQGVTNQTALAIGDENKITIQDQDPAYMTNNESALINAKIYGYDSNNETQSQTAEINVTLAEQNTTGNTTQQDTDSQNAIINQTLPAYPILDVELSYPKNLTRGSGVSVVATITNTGSGKANNIGVLWDLPEGFESVSIENNCVSLEQGESCSSKITASTSYATQKGGNSIKVDIKYE